MDALLFHNPHAGSGDHSKKDMLEVLSSAGFRVTYCSTKGPDFKAMLKETADMVVIAGGDGTVRPHHSYSHPSLGYRQQPRRPSASAAM